MFRTLSIRCYHLSPVVQAAEKSSLAKLRKSTGYTFANCKKALELHNNDLAEAEKWLKEQAQAMGWSKANKLEGRTTAQGLVGILIEKNIGALVEVNCETDFVARNSEFQAFVEKAAKSCIKYISGVDSTTQLTKIGIGSDALKNIKYDDNKTLGDHLALLIGTVGENTNLRRAICYKVPETLQLVGYAHSTVDQQTSGNLLRGKYGALAAFRASTNSQDDKLEVQKKILQHIIGLNPQKVGDKDQDKPEKDKDDEKCLIYQEFLLDQDITVGELLAENELEVVDFQRFECGDTQTEINGQQ